MVRTQIALFGLGRIGQIHLENILINPKIELLYICDAIKQHAENIKEKYALTATVLGLNEFDIAFADPKLDGVIVGTPTGELNQN
jgi:myo-inositol 2-dehydrogenase/D-chiro-inositol 1-dehydrogenase